MNDREPTLSAHRKQHQYADEIRRLVLQMKSFPELQEECRQLDAVVEGIVQPFSIAIFGRMKTGKSSILNAILGYPLTITGVNEATATINHISYGTGEQLNNFRVHWNDEAPETLPLSALQEKWTGTSDEVLKTISRTDYLELYSDAPLLKAVNIIDTPGTGSIATEHEEIAQQFIGGQETDALIYVFSPVGRETDEQDLRTFRDSCLPSSSPYNSVALLHKWDALYWDNGGNMDEVISKAKRLESVMNDLVACVLPVSAPLAFIAKRAGVDFWERCLELLSGFSEDSLLTRALSREDKWKRDARQAELYEIAHTTYDMPWASFRVMLRHLYRMADRTLNSCPGALAELSGFAKLEAMLDRQIFMHAGIIKQWQMRTRVIRALDALYTRTGQLLSDYESDNSYLQQIGEQLKEHRLKGWTERKCYELKQRIDTLRRSWIEWDYKRREIADAADLDKHGLEARKWLQQGQNIFTPEETEKLLLIIDIVAGTNEGTLSPSELRDLNIATSLHMQEPQAKVRHIAEHLKAHVLAAARILLPKAKA